jgi:hypothetical protein
LPDALERYEPVFNELLAASDAGSFPVANEGGVDDPVPSSFGTSLLGLVGVDDPGVHWPNGE